MHLLKRNSFHLIALFLIFFGLYQISLAIRPVRFSIRDPTAWHMFGADSMAFLYKFKKDPWKSFMARKHPLFPIVVRPLYVLGKRLWRPIPGAEGENLAFTFPIALIGAADVCLFFLVLRLNDPNRTTSVLFAFLYGVSASKWIFSGIPETYAVTAACTTFFLLVLLRQGETKHGVVKTACANSLACYASPQQILLVVVPNLYFLLTDKWSPIRQVLKYVLIILAVFVLPYVFLISSHGMDWRFPEEYVRTYGHINYFLDPRLYALAIFNFFVFAIVGPAVDPSLYGDPSLAAVTFSSWTWKLLAVLYIVIWMRSIRGLRHADSKLKRICFSIYVFLCMYALFFLYFNPKEFFIYTLPVLSLLLLAVHCGYLQHVGWKWHLTLLIFLMALIINNGHLIGILNTFQP